MTASNAAALDAPEVKAPQAGRLLTAEEFSKVQDQVEAKAREQRAQAEMIAREEGRLAKMSDRQFMGEVRRASTSTTLISGGFQAFVFRVLEGDSLGNDPYCLRAPKRGKIGRPK